MTTALSLLLPLLLALGASAQTASSLKLTQTIPLPGVSGRLDHLAFDAQRQRLYLAASGNDSVEVVDVVAAKALRPLPVKDPHDLLILPKPNLLYVTSGTDGHVKVFDCAAGRAIKTIGPLPDADNLRFDAPGNRVYVAHGDGALTMLNVQTGVQTVSIPLAGHPEAFAIESTGDRIFVNVPAVKHVAVIQRVSREVIATWPLGDGSGNYALALDEPNQRLFIGCRQPPRLVVLDAKSGKAVAHCDIAGDVDDLFFDAKRKRLYASCGEGFLEAIDQTDSDHYQPQPRLPTAKGARTSFLAAEAGLLFVAVPGLVGKPAEVRVYRLAP
jgi:DNA-binding beta-propeller fold protein YncE